MRTLPILPLILLAGTALAQAPADPPPAAPAADRTSYLASGPREMFQKGIELVDRGAVQEAKTVFTALTLAYPQLPEPYINLAVLLAAEGGEAEAAAAAEAALRAHPVCRAAFDLEFQRQLGGYSATVISIGEPAGQAASREAPSPPRRSIGASDLPRAAAATVAEAGFRVVGKIESSCLKLRPQPDLDNQAVDCLPPGTRVRVRETAAAWSRVELDDGRQGWMATPYLAEPEAGPGEE